MNVMQSSGVYAAAARRWEQEKFGFKKHEEGILLKYDVE